MVAVLNLVLLIVAAVCFGFAAISPGVDKLKMIAFGLFAWALAVLVPAAVAFGGK